MASESASRAFMSEAKELVDAGQFGKAIEVLQAGLKEFPKMVSARVFLGEVCWTSGDLALARVELEQVIKAAPDNFAAYRRLAQVYHELGDTASAVKACETILHANPKDREMGELLKELQGGGAKAALAQKAKHAEKHEAAAGAGLAGDVTDSVTLADLYISQGHREKGLEVYRRLVAKEPDNIRLREKIRKLAEEEVGASQAPAKASQVTSDQAKRKARIRRLEGWLAVIRKRRLT